MQSIDKDNFLWILEISIALKLDPTFFLNLGGSSVFIVPLFISSSIWVPVAIKALKLESIVQTNICGIQAINSLQPWLTVPPHLAYSSSMLPRLST